MEELIYTNLRQVAEHAKTLFKHHEKTEGRNEFYSFTREAIHSPDPIYEALSDKMRDMPMDEDSRYEFTVSAIDNILDGDLEYVEDYDIEVIQEWADSDTDVYTSDLTEWLNRSAENVSYLTEALEEYGEKDGFKALQLAQMNAREEVYHEIVDALSKFVGTEESKDE